MSPKYILSVVTLSAVLSGCGGSDSPPEINSTNCSGAGMQAILPGFKSETDRQTFIDKCQSLTQK